MYSYLFDTYHIAWYFEYNSIYEAKVDKILGIIYGKNITKYRGFFCNTESGRWEQIP